MQHVGAPLAANRLLTGAYAWHDIGQMANKSPISTAASPGAVQPPPLLYYVSLTVASTAVWTALIGPLLVLLPEQSALLAGDGKEEAFAVIAGVGGLLGIVTNPVFGRLSDRTRSRFGRRRPWILAGGLGSVPALVFTGQSTGVMGLLIGWAAVQMFANFIIAGLSATIPDRVPENRRGAASACMGISWALAPVLGTGLTAATAGDPQLAYGVLAGFVLVSCLVFVVMVPEPQVISPKVKSSSFLGIFWVNPRRHPDFGYAWLTRFCVALGQNMAIALLFFYLSDVIRYKDDHPGQTVADGMVIATILYAIAVVAAAVIGGILSDRLGRRKVFVTTATVVFAIGTGLGALYPSWTGVLVLAAVTGLGFGVYEAVDMALVTQVLPSQEDLAKDLGLINMATTLGVTIGPLVATPMLNAGGYPAVYLMSGFIVLLGAMFVRPIRGVR